MMSMFALWASALLAIGGSVTELTITPMASQTSVLIAVEGDVEYRDFTMEGPHRLVLDLMGSQHALPRGEFAAINRGGIRSVRSSQYSETVVRVVFVLDEQLGYTVLPDPRGLRISLQNPGGDFEPWSSTVAPRVAFNPPAPEREASLQVAPGQSQARRISVTWTEAPINDVLLAFAAFSGTSIVPGSNVTGFVTADINDQPWDVALRTILGGQGLVASEDDYGIIRVDNITDLNDRELIEQILTVPYRVSFATAAEVATAVTPLLTDRGSVTIGQGTNTLIVSDIQRVQNAIATLLANLDIETPQVSISAKIVFVNRTELDEFGVTYELKDSQGNQFNRLSAGLADLDGDGTPEQQDETLVLLGGNSVAALGNATARVAGPTLSLLTSLVVGRHQLLAFIDALESVSLSDIEATPQVTVVDNQTARLQVGARTAVRSIDAGAGAGGGAGGAFPVAAVTFEETGVILNATPHVTADGHILLDLDVERSSPVLEDGGFSAQKQQGSTRVLAEDGETIVMGGLTQVEFSETRAGIPILQDLPLIGSLFRVVRQREVQTDLIILVTPNIIR